MLVSTLGSGVATGNWTRLEFKEEFKGERGLANPLNLTVPLRAMLNVDWAYGVKGRISTSSQYHATQIQYLLK